MALNVPNAGEKIMLDRIVGNVATGDLEIALYTNNVTIDDTNVIGDFTEELTSTEGGAVDGYVTMDGTWTVVSGDASYPQMTYTYTGAVAAIYGYVVTDGTVALWAEKFSDGPYVIPTGGGTVKVTPVITLQ